jgi:hypothetical protein
MAYSQVQNYSYQFFPPPYDFLAPPRTTGKPGQVVPEDALQMQGRGLGSACNGLGCAACGGTCGQNGMGQTDSAGLFGTGLFTSADPTQWGWGEYLTIFLGGYLVINLFGDVSKGARAAYSPIKRARARSRKRAQLQSEMDSL